MKIVVPFQKRIHRARGLFRMPPPIMVVSHERSGTHFLMNSVEECFGYNGTKFRNVDVPDLSANFDDPTSLSNAILQSTRTPIQRARILKSHHPAEFFEGCLNELLSEIRIIYIVRDPRAVMRSFHFYLNALPWNEGPKCSTLAQFLGATPTGRILRYQKQHQTNLLKRWESHVKHWACTQHEHFRCIRYEDLDRAFESTILSLEAFIGLRALRIARPSRHENVVRTGAQPDVYESEFTAADNSFLLNEVGGTMASFNYPDLEADDFAYPDAGILK